MIRFGTQQTFHIGELSEVAAARRAGIKLAQKLGFNELRTAQLAIVITEAATNIAKHAAHGEILLRSLQHGETTGVEIIAIDAGPGISNIRLQMIDGNSTTGTYGGGLGAISRLSQEFEMYSMQEQGTALWVVIWVNDKALKLSSDWRFAASWEIGGICVPYPGEALCGDAWTVVFDNNLLTFMVADGLGHGPDAAIASNTAVNVIAEHQGQSPQALLQRAHVALQKTRGAAVAIGQINMELGQLRFAGVGNIAASVFEVATRRHLLSHNGIAGSNLRKLQEFSQTWESGAMFIAHSDGLATRWNLDKYVGLAQSHPSLIAAVLYRDFTRGRDDVSVLVLRQTRH
ncbi:MAG: SpoIIE family protein phosphatase [Pseudomonadota bacterium]